jgi:hypothetical protein
MPIIAAWNCKSSFCSDRQLAASTILSEFRLLFENSPLICVGTFDNRSRIASTAVRANQLSWLSTLPADASGVDWAAKLIDSDRNARFANIAEPRKRRMDMERPVHTSVQQKRLDKPATVCPAKPPALPV